MTALETFLHRLEFNRFCPCCKDRGLHDDDMDDGHGWEHSAAMRAVYGAPCCVGCTDDHIVTEDGVCMPRDNATQDDGGDYWADADNIGVDGTYQDFCNENRTHGGTI